MFHFRKCTFSAEQSHLFSVIGPKYSDISTLRHFDTTAKISRCRSVCHIPLLTAD